MKPSKQITLLISALTFLLPANGVSAADNLIDLIPDNAFIAVHIARPQRALPPTLLDPLIEALTDNKTAARPFIEAVKRLPGPLLIGVIPPAPRSKDAPVIFVAMEMTGPQIDFDDLVKNTLLPAIEALGKAPPGGRFRVETGKTGSRILSRKSGDTVFAYAVKGRIAFGATNPQLALRWARGEWPKRRWTGMPGVQKLLRGLPKAVSVRGYINPVPLIRQIEKPPPNSPEELALKILAPEDFQAAVLDLSWARSTLSIQLSIALADECQGIARVLARPSNSARSLGVFPEDFVALGRIGWNSAADLAAGVYALSDRFDKSISAEYREELAEFRRETEVDWDTAFLGNLGGELAFGIRVDFTHRPPIGWALVFPLASEAEFRKQFDRLITAFDLTFEDTEEDGLLIRKAVTVKTQSAEGVQQPGQIPAPSGFHIAINRGLLVVGSHRQTVADIVKRAATPEADKPAGRNLRACYEALPESNHMVVMLDIEQLRKKVPILPMAVGPALAPLMMQGSAGAAITVAEGVARLDLRWSLKAPGGRKQKAQASPPAEAPQASEAFAALATVLWKSIARARLLSQRTISAANMRGIGQALYVYANKHDGAFPESLAALLRAMPDEVKLEMLTSPYTGRGPKSIDDVKRDSYLVYRPGLSTGSSPMEVLLAERKLSAGDGASFLFQDGHTEFILEPRASILLQLIAEGAEQVQR